MLINWTDLNLLKKEIVGKLFVFDLIKEKTRGTVEGVSVTSTVFSFCRKTKKGTEFFELDREKVHRIFRDESGKIEMHCAEDVVLTIG